jgi:hypothetical protein
MDTTQGSNECNTSNEFDITFETTQYCENTSLNIPFNKIKQWSNRSEYLETLIKSKPDEKKIMINVSHVVDLETLLLVFKYLDEGYIYKVDNKQKENLFVGLAYFGIDQDDLKTIRKCLGIVYNVTVEDKQIQNDEITLRTTINISTSQECRNLDKQYVCNLLLGEHKLTNYPLFCPSLWGKNFKPIDKVNSTERVIELFKTETKNIFNKFPNCVVAGGKIFGYATDQQKEKQYAHSDFDIFVLANNQNEVLNTIRDFYNEVVQTFEHVNVLKTKYTITMYNSFVEFQIIRKCYKSVTDVLTDFDIDCCCIGILNSQLFTLPRFHRSLLYKGNLINPNKFSNLYIERLVKYVDRGMCVFVPGLNTSDPNFNSKCSLLQRAKNVQKYEGRCFPSQQHGYHFDIVKKYFRHHSRIVGEVYEHSEQKRAWTKSDQLDVDKLQFINNVSEFVQTVIDSNVVFCHSNIFEKQNTHTNSIYHDMYISPLVR